MAHNCNQTYCAHLHVKYCPCCGKVYCSDCGQTWSKDWTWTYQPYIYAPPYTITWGQSYGGCQSTGMDNRGNYTEPPKEVQITCNHN
jgi:hypothetical protein